MTHAYLAGTQIGEVVAARFSHVDLRWFHDYQLARLLRLLILRHPGRVSSLALDVMPKNPDPFDPGSFNPEFFAGFAYAMRNHEAAA